MNAQESYREYLTRIWVADSVESVHKHNKNKWQRLKRWIGRRFTR